MPRAAIRPLVLEFGTGGEEVRRLNGATNLDAGVVSAAVPPAMKRSYELSWELLYAFGKECDVAGAGRHESINWEVLVAWVLAHQVQHVILVDAQWLRRSMLEDVIGLAAVSGATLWLVAQHPLEDEYEQSLALWPTEPATHLDLVPVLEAAATVTTQGVPLPFPAVPPENFTTFRAEARRRLAPDDFEVVDARYTAAFGGARDWFARAGVVDEETVLGLVRAQLHVCTNADEMLCVVRAIQAAAFRAGWLVSAELDRLIVTAESAARAAVHSPHTWTRLRAYREPYRGAACALTATELCVDAMVALVLGDIDSDGCRLNVDGRSIEVPRRAEVYMRALLWQRRLQGAGPSDLLFADDDGPMRAKYLADAIRCPITELGIPLYSQQVQRAELDPRRWSQRWGLSVRVLS